MQKQKVYSTKKAEKPLTTGIYRLIATQYTIFKKASLIILLFIFINRLLLFAADPKLLGKFNLNYQNIQDLSTQKAFLLLAIFLQSWITACFIFSYISNICRNRKNPVTKSLTRAIGCFHRTVFCAILYVMIVMVGFCLIIAPGIYFLVMFSMFFNLIVIDNKGIIESLKMSKAITKNNKILILTTLVLAYVIPSVLSFHMANSVLAHVDNLYVKECVILLSMTLTYIIFAGTLIFLYEDLKLRYIESTT